MADRQARSGLRYKPKDSGYHPDCKLQGSTADRRYSVPVFGVHPRQPCRTARPACGVVIVVTLAASEATAKHVSCWRPAESRRPRGRPRTSARSPRFQPPYPTIPAPVLSGSRTYHPFAVKVGVGMHAAVDVGFPAVVEALGRGWRKYRLYLSE